MQRPTSSSRASDDHNHHVIDIMKQSQAKHSPKRKTEDLTDLSLFEPSSIGRREMSLGRLLEKWIHAIPVITLLCLFILWWFTYPVNLEIKDGRLIAAHKIEMPQPLNDTLVDHAILALATAPKASLPQILAPTENETEAPPENMTEYITLLHDKLGTMVETFLCQIYTEKMRNSKFSQPILSCQSVMLVS